MMTERDPTSVPAVPAEPAPTREELEARMDQARGSIERTVEQIKETVGERVDAVSDTVSGVVSLAGQFQREPVAWSLGALSAGFAMGYSLGRAHHAKGAGGRPSKLARLADDIAGELASFGGSLVSPGLDAELKATFGVELSSALERIAALQTRPAVLRKRLTKPKPSAKPSRRRPVKSPARKRTKGR